VLDAIPVACHHIGRFLERVRAEDALHETTMELSALASTDSLTGLNNRREFDRALRTIPRQPFAVLSLDLDGLKATNDTHGHAAGDALLRTVGHTLGLLVRGWDVMARVGGDEFAALLPEVGVFGANLVADRMRVAMHSLVLPSGPVRITVGWSAAPAGTDPVSVWQRADESLYKAKHAGGNRVMGCSYERGEAGDIADRSYSDVITHLLEGGPITTMFQPIVELVDGSVLGYEALARPEGFAAMDSVEAVFEAARTSGHIRDLDWVCRRRALEDAKQLPAGVALFLNISAAALLDPVHGVDQLLLLLHTVRRAPQTVVLEITEHERIRDYERLGNVLAAYRAEGIRFALDDVGEGHSTLELLAASASEYLKLGRSLTMTSNRIGSKAAMHATMAFARVSGAVVIAEGIENEFVADLMKAAGIRYGQGFGLGKPTKTSDIEDVGKALAGRAALSGLRPRAVVAPVGTTRSWVSEARLHC
jgi:diguanylate cyclase (GGDEF)-like protein